MITDKKMNSQMVLNSIMTGLYEKLEELYSPEYEGIFQLKNTNTLEVIDTLINQISSDQSIGNIRSAFRKAVILKGLLGRIERW